MIDKARVRNEAAALEAEIGDDALEKLDRYFELLIKTNETLNLTRVTEPREVETKHILDSLSLLSLPELAGSVADVGTGAGIPGAVLAAARADLALTLIDSTEKKLRFVDKALEECGIKNAVTLHARAEELGRDAKYRQRFDTVVARAVANLASLCEYCLPLVKVGGAFIAMKTERADEELAEAKSAVEELGGELEYIRELTLPDGARRALIVIKKISQTPPKYPRSQKNIAKSPIT